MEKLNQQASIHLTQLYQGKEVALLEDPIMEYLQAEDEAEAAQCLEKYFAQKYDYQKVTVQWKLGEQRTKYTVEIASNDTFEESLSFVTPDVIYMFSHLIPWKKYYYRITDELGNASITDSFIVQGDSVRVLTISGVENARDVGGWNTEDGKKVQYGLLYRGARLNSSINEAGITLMNKILNINTELDLRGNDAGGQIANVFNAKKPYVKVPLSQYTYLLPQFKQEEPIERGYNIGTGAALVKIFTCLTNEENYPIYFHCNAGADRTGTLSFLILGAIGVEYKNIVKDFELTSFSDQGRRWRSDIVNGKFTTDGVMQDDANNYVAFGKMYDMFMQYYGETDNKLSTAVKNYLYDVSNGVIDDNVIVRLKDILLKS